MERVLIIEDEASILRGLKDNLEAEGYSVITSSDGKKGLEKALKENVNLVLLDLMLPGINGLDICKQIKLKKIALPIIMLTAKSTEADKVLGLGLGADDYITKPFGVSELLARVKAVLRRVTVHKKAKKEKIASYKIGNVFIDFIKLEATNAKKKLKLSKKEFDIIEYLIKRKGEVVTRNDLLDAVWGYESFPTTRTVDNFIARIRKQIEDKPAKPKYLLSMRSAGYKLVT